MCGVLRGEARFACLLVELVPRSIARVPGPVRSLRLDALDRTERLTLLFGTCIFADIKCATLAGTLGPKVCQLGRWPVPWGPGLQIGTLAGHPGPRSGNCYAGHLGP